MTQKHEREWKRFANDQKLNMKRVPGISFIEYEYASTRLARAAWDRRSEVEISDGARVYYNVGIQHASEIVFKLHGEAAAKAIQALKK